MIQTKLEHKSQYISIHDILKTDVVISNSSPEQTRAGRDSKILYKKKTKKPRVV